VHPARSLVQKVITMPSVSAARVRRTIRSSRSERYVDGWAGDQDERGVLFAAKIMAMHDAVTSSRLVLDLVLFRAGLTNQDEEKRTESSPWEASKSASLPWLAQMPWISNISFPGRVAKGCVD
jgi:hypothetical protein